MSGREVVIVGAARTPIGSFLGSLAAVPAPRLGAVAIRAALLRAGVDPAAVDEVVMGNVLQAGVGQAPARQAARYAGIPDGTPAWTLNKVCGSGLKAVISAAQAIALGDADVMVAGGMESMSNVPYYDTQAAHRRRAWATSTLVDGMVHDGLTDAYDGVHMGICAEATRREVRHLPRRPGRLRRRVDPTRHRGAEGRPLREGDRPGRDRGQEGREDRRLRGRRPEERPARQDRAR